MAELRITVCDQCGALDRTVRRFTVITDRRSVKLDLCDEHGAALDAAVDLVPEGRPKVREISAVLQSTAGPAVIVGPVDEIAARKRSHKPRPKP